MAGAKKRHPPTFALIISPSQAKGDLCRRVLKDIQHDDYTSLFYSYAGRVYPLASHIMSHTPRTLTRSLGNIK
jgi:hypothetical protein